MGTLSKAQSSRILSGTASCPPKQMREQQENTEVEYEKKIAVFTTAENCVFINRCLLVHKPWLINEVEKM